ncbi:MAG TPA: hypothetical protein DIU01_00845, partial [Flavobacterium sp.]|nr:hypothetical protein [Flavobacterium sp.]
MFTTTSSSAIVFAIDALLNAIIAIAVKNTFFIFLNFKINKNWLVIHCKIEKKKYGFRKIFHKINKNLTSYV